LRSAGHATGTPVAFVGAGGNRSAIHSNFTAIGFRPSL